MNDAADELPKTIRVGAIPVTVGDDLKRDVLTATRACLAGRHGSLRVTFCNPGSHVRILSDVVLAADLDEFDYVLADGMGLTLCARMLGHACDRLSFDTTSLALPVLQAAVDADASVALVGGRPGVPERARQRLVDALGADPFVATLDGYRPQKDLARELLALRPDLVICGMGTGPQEHLLATLARSGHEGCAFTCGGYLDQLADGLHYYPAIVDALHLRFAYRLLSEPRRLAPRYLVDYPRFGLAFLAQRLGRTT